MTVHTETVPVLIVGGGYAGLSTALFLAHHGVRPVLVDRHAGVSMIGRARGINPRTMEIYRALGLAEQVKEAGRPFEQDSGIVRCASLADEWHWILDEAMPNELPELSAGAFGLADQSAVEPILADAARAKGADLRFGRRCVEIHPEADGGVTAVIEDLSTGVRSTIRARYLVAADGYRGTIRESLGIERLDHQVVRSYISYVVKADLSDLVPKRALFWIIGGPGSAASGAVSGHALPGRWGFAVNYDPATESLDDYTAERCADLARKLVGRDVDVEVTDRGSWDEAVGVAERYRSGSVFLVGDAAHVWPPAGAFGANSAVQDAHNLAWKLAAVLNGSAGDALLDAYESERRPVALALADLTVRSQAARFGPEQGEDPLDPILCILGQRYIPGEDVFGDSVEQHARTGTRAPHLWLERNGGDRIGVHDLFHDSFVLLAGPDFTGEPPASPLPIRTHRLGKDLVDVEGRWSDRYGLPADGAVLVRPDGYISWRSDQPGEAAV